MDDDDRYDGNSTFEQFYRCYPVSCIDKAHLEKGDKVIMPPSALDQLAYLEIDYPMLFQISNPSAGKITHCGVLEFTADEGLIYLPNWMMENMVLQQGAVVLVKNASLAKGTYVKLQPHTTDFLDVSNPKAILETTLRSYSCLTTGDSIMIPYNNKKFYIDIVETKPSDAICIIETDCEVDFAPPLDFQEPEKPANSTLPTRTRPEVNEEPEAKIPKLSPFSGSARRLDGKPSSQNVMPNSSPVMKPFKPDDGSGANGSKSNSSSQHSGKLVFGSKPADTPNGKTKTSSKDSTQQDQSQNNEETKFKAFTGKKFSLKD